MATPRLVPLSMLLPPPEPLRVAMSEKGIAELVESIRELGILLPLVVLPRWGDGPGTWREAPDAKLGDNPEQPDAYEIVDGHRRFMASGELKLAEVPVMVFAGMDEAKFAMMLHANIMREDVTPYEEGVQFLDLATKYQWTMDQLMRFFRRSEDYINDRVGVVQGDQQVAEALRDRRIGLGQAKEILKCGNPVQRLGLLEQAAVHGATIGALREMRHTFMREDQAAQGVIPMNVSPQSVPEGVFPENVCIFCGRGDDAYNIVRIPIHSYHQADLKAVLDTLGIRALIERTAKIE